MRPIGRGWNETSPLRSELDEDKGDTRAVADGVVGPRPIVRLAAGGVDRLDEMRPGASMTVTGMSPSSLA
jgi:hypothetical protein